MKYSYINFGEKWGFKEVHVLKFDAEFYGWRVRFFPTPKSSIDVFRLDK